MRDRRELSVGKIINWGEVLVLAAMAPLFVFPKMNSSWTYLVLPLIWCLRRAWGEKVRDGKARTEAVEKIVRAAGLLLAVQLVFSSLFIREIGDAWPKIVGLAYGLLVYFALIRILNHEATVKFGLSIFLGGGIALAMAGFLGMLISDEPFWGTFVGPLMKNFPRRTGIFPGAEAGFNPNGVAGAMMLFVPLVLVMTVEAMKSMKTPMMHRIFLGGVTLFCLVVLFVTQSVESWLALALGLWLVLPTLRRKALAAVGIAVLAVMILVVIPSRTPGSGESNKNYLVVKIESRFRLWQAGIAAVKERPLTGIGLNQLRGRPPMKEEDAHAHNQLLHTAAELGLPGLLAYLAILLGAGRACFRLIRFAGTRWMRVAGQGLGAGQAAFFFFGMGDAIPLGSKPGVFFWVSIALIVSLHRVMLISPVSQREL